MFKEISNFFNNGWIRFKRYYVLKHNRAFKGKGVNEKYASVTLFTRHSIELLILAIFAIIISLLIIEAMRDGVGIGTQFHIWIKKLLGMKIPATNPTK